ncbi:MAG: hypothetical protein AAB669_01320 [Patescibacteria group bacterium]
MKNKQKILQGLASAVFWISVPLVVIFCLSPIQKFINDPSKSGVGWYACAACFLAIMWPLSRSDYDENPSKTAWQTKFIYGWWLFWVSVDLTTILYLRWKVGNWDLGALQLLMIYVSLGCFVAVWFVSVLYGWRMKNSYVRAAISIAWKSVSQFLLAWAVWNTGRGDWVLPALIAGILTIVARLTQVGVSVTVDGWTHQRRAITISEAVNLGSWLAVVAVWSVK